MLRFGLVKRHWRIGIIKIHALLAASFATPTSEFKLLWLSKQSFDHIGSPIAFRKTQGLIQNVLATMKMNIQVPSYTQFCRRQAKVVAFSAAVPCEDSIIEALHLVIDSTGLKVYREGDEAAL
ncbi:transposase [Runella limosa]|uniref:transposase n=1 Tax=Runella limosa TaxID=370978 RepID=UPI00048D1054|nr:transposase [Runella limosa]